MKVNSTDHCELKKTLTIDELNTVSGGIKRIRNAIKRKNGFFAKIINIARDFPLPGV